MVLGKNFDDINKPLTNFHSASEVKNTWSYVDLVPEVKFVPEAPCDDTPDWVN